MNSAPRKVVHHIVWAQQHIDRASGVAQVAVLGAAYRLRAAQHAQLHPDLVTLVHGAGQEHTLADEIGDEAVGRLVVELVSAVPLLDPAFAHDADLVGDREGLVLVMRHQQCGGSCGLEQRAQLSAQALAKIDVEV